MSAYRIALFAVYGMGAVYFILKKRRFDFFTVGFFSACVYFVPGLFGYATYPLAYAYFGSVDLAPATYFVMIAVLGSILAGAFWYDLVPHRVEYELTIPGSGMAGVFALGIGLIGFVMTVATSGSALLDPDKGIVLASFNRWAILWEMGASVAAVLLVSRGRWVLFSVAAILLLAEVYVGVRVTVALVFIAIVTLRSEAKGRRRFLIAGRYLLLAAACFAAFLLVYKTVFVFMKAGDWAELNRRLRDSETYSVSVSNAEPFITQAILNEVLVTRFHVGPQHLKSALWQLVFFAPNLGAEPVSFNDLFQPQLFPWAIGWGMANNIWAEMWSSGGAGLLGGFIAFFVATLAVGSRLLRVNNREFRAASALLFSYWAFYIHRNDVLVELNYVKRVGLVAAICLLGSAILYDVAHRIRRRVRRSAAVAD